MKFCRRCLYPDNHSLNLIFDAEGICSGCRVHEEKYQIDWLEKEKELSSLITQYKNRPNTSYDCVIPVVGSGDDFFIVDLIKNKYGLNPLLVTYNTHFSTKVGVRNLARLITKLDCDHMMSTVGPDTVKEITRITLRKFGDIYWHVLAGNQTFPVQVATKLNIPLIIWGVNGWLDQVGMFSHHDRVEMTKKVRKEHALRGYDAESLIGESNKITKKDLQAFTYPSDEQLEKSRVRGIYLGNYLFWDSQKQIESMIDKFGYETHEQERTFNLYESIYCTNNASVHDYIKYLKFGYSKVSDHVARDIRLGRINISKGMELINKYLAVKPKSLQLFLDWIGMEEEELMMYIDKHRDPKAWRKKNNEEWECYGSIINNPLLIGTEDKLSIHDPLKYIQTPLLEEQNWLTEYILLGRTYMDEVNFKAKEG
ncbi:N-acetyl sugar amidotransferase [Xenorhabdus bovienii]|uniref:N-acetyl sugar amidotransferase n=1 Tax=Xenorhabdus bovienii TaxID=40576 RepID=UPI0023B27527|nr:N-acetyl sugar amidotransferase [Xenorhabdus bovienii]MDE9493195.1 N-acetyl sugar amidotransferase [Xenorhabdus bovienii]MDE9501731.1 N-acetyl sugar amidotransferase [Xenorhabdus bovienii]MDE9525515.1 N-acetyl sugar amidotransferase [Xenorhabdus bovienii]MDE9568048.1 N-acetyl sugar amidotransferase [Xenorhabdus bovienii]